ncbi:PREDICTED: DNA polymerase zeta catalytic subunit isoform X1 [Bactrocera latifrons]|uniref:DNA polymerase zeta catalytic subunit n=1 Tax=Bactrocera latifrons TaxID=174628 RepID=A0A0K8VNW1_BACLA|nr:PREDICTED: DNA polymerase zeta catalytic subunit isoform X1 [Bactrocera latifrons]
MSKSREDAGVFSVRLVIADFYMEKPIFGFDPCYSEFRGKEIKRVPIIRIFGSSADGRKTCMHVHGVFPYFYIPYEAKEFESLNKAIYQITSNVDKAINVSLGQACSSAIHVFKVQLVKGIPFYGYHRGEHQLLKIYMFNPRFVRRAANLLQSGAVMNKNFHPFESHVPYILQFMIDYNLYGMSFVHIPLDVVKFRQTGDGQNSTVESHIPALKQAQFLDPTVAKKQSTCEFEVDIGSNFILNRFQLALRSNNSKTHSNPGIEAIWNDERLRRQKMAERPDVEKVPDLELPPTQERCNVQPTESDIFHRTVLQSKLMALELAATGNVGQADQSMNLTLQTSSANFTLLNSGDKEQHHTFNLRKIIGNAIYPEECTPDENLVDASFIENHVSQNGFQISSSVIQSAATPPINEQIADRGDSIFLDDTVVDEEIFSNLNAETPKQLNMRMGAEDLELLDILQQLEEHEEDENQIDLDSTLAPLTQTLNKFDPSPDLLDKQVIAAAMSQPMPECDTDSDTSENGNIHDYSIILEDMDELILKFTPSQPTEEAGNQIFLPQMDGSDDLLPKTPVKGASSAQTGNKRNVLSSPRTPRTTNRSHTSPKRSPRTPKSSASKKYAPLPLTITCKKQERNVANEAETTPARHTVLRNLDLGSCDVKSTKMTLSKKLALTALRRKSVDWSPSTTRQHFTANKEPSGELSVKRTPIRRSRRTMDLDRTHITCELTPRRKSERILKVYSIEEEQVVNAAEGTRKSRSVTSLTRKCGPDPQKQNKTKETLTEACKNECRNKPSKVAKTKNQTEDIPNTENLKRRPEPHQHKIRKCVVRISKRFKREGLDSSNTNTPESSKLIANNNDNEISDHRHEELSKSTICPSPQLNQEKRLPNNTSPQSNSSDSDEIAASDTEDAPTSISAKRLRRSFHLVQHRRMQTNDVSNKSIHETTKGDDNMTKSSTSPTETLKIDSEDCADIEDPHIQSFYDISFTEDLCSLSNLSPTNVNFVKDGSSIPLIRDESHNSLHCGQGATLMPISSTICNNTTPLLTVSATNSAKQLVQLTPLNLPPSYEEVLASCAKLDIPQYEFQKPFYGNPDDITRLKEVGHIALHIPGNTLNDCEEFKSVLGDELKCLTEWRRQQMLTLSGPSTLTTHCSHRNAQRIREYFASPKRVTITPHIHAPTRQEAKLWLKARDLLAKSGACAQNKVTLDESPIKVRRQKTTMILNDGGGGGEDDEDILNNTNCITLTPPTPLVNTQRSSSAANTTEKTTVKAHACAKVKSRTKRAKLSLNKQLMACASPEMSMLTADASLQLSQSVQNTQTLSSEQVVSSNDTTISNENVLKALERNSFLKDLQSKAAPLSHELSFGLSSASLDNTFGFKVNLENLQQAKSDVECNYLTTIILELFVPTRGNLLPDPVHDEVRCLFYAIEHRSPATKTKGDNLLPQNDCGCIIVKDIESDNAGQDHRMYGTGGNDDVTMRFVNTEIEAFEALVELSMRWDPDIYGGYEIETASWGYVLERGKHLGFNIAPLLSRVPTQKVREYVDEDREHFTDLDIELKLCGRILLDVWRLMRSEIALTSYTFENVMYHILHKRCPAYNHRALTEWFEVPYTRWIVIEYYVERVRGTLALLDQLDLIGRTSEMAKLIGIQFYEVLSRGSQFRVESMMLRIAKPRNLVPLSPSVQQRAHMRAPEYLPLILEPQSRFYADPVIVLDFQSLYPSMIIAYNYCFSTCLGRVEHLGHSTPFEFGASQLRVSPTLLRRLIDDDLITISPCGAVFVKSSVREGILPRMLSEILNTRQMVKQSMKLDKSNSALQRILHSRQLGLKLMANVTYGYTAANFSGRMPAVEVGDSVVAKGRETLERAIRMVESNEKWRVRVVYGDTDSMFVQVPGRNREQAFKIGEEIAASVTKDNPQPVKLKLEKVYQPCILQTKKRYVGYMYETADQAEPVYEAKGIETVRRDGCPAVAKMLEKVLRILFETTDVSKIKHYVCRQFSKLLAGRANLQDLIFAKEFRGLNGYKPTACVPALELTRRWLQTDPRRIPRCGERVPFIIVNGPPGVPLIRLVRSPHEVLADEGLKINAIYYITKAIIPPLNRCLLLIGADVNEWFASLPRKLLIVPPVSTANKLAFNVEPANHAKKSTISQYFSATNCIANCGRQTKQGICAECERQPQRTFVILHQKMAKIERGYQLVQQICQACCGRVGEFKCSSLDCPVLYVNEVKRRDLQQVVHIRKLLAERF